MSFGSRLYQIFRAPVDFGVQTTDLFVDTIRLASDEEYGTFEAFNESWKDNVMGKISASNEGVAGRSVLGSFFGPDSGLGAIVGAIPEDVRERPASLWNVTMDGYNYAYKNFVDRPIGFMVSMGSLNPFQSRDPNTGMVDGRGFNTKIFEYDTYKNVWGLTEDRSAGQAIMMFSGNVDILNPVSVSEFKQTPKYQFVSGIFDAGLNVVGDPGWVTAKSFRTIRNIRNAQTNRLRSGSDQLFPEEVVEYIDIDGSGNAIPVTRIEDGVMPNESMGPFYQPVRQPVRNQPIIVRTPNKRPIRIGGQKLHEKIQQFEGQYPLLERLLGGSVLDMLTVGGGKVIGSRRTVDDLLFEKWQYQPKWMDDVPHTPDVIDATLTPVKKELQQLVVDTTTELAVFGVRPSVTYLQTGDLGANSRFGQNLNEDGIVPAIEIASRQNVLGDTNFSLLSGIDELAENYLQQELGPNTSDPFPISLAEGEVTPITDELRANLVDYKNAKDSYANNILDALNADETLVNIVRRLQTEEGVRAGILAFREGTETPLDLNDAYGEVTYDNLKDDFELSLSQSVLPLDGVDADLASGIARINNELEEAATTYINSIRLDLSTPDNRDYVSEGPSGDPLDSVLEAELKVAALIAKRIELELYGAYIDNLFMPAEKVKNSLFVLETKVPKSGDYDLDKFYGTGLWHVNKNTQFQEILAFRVFNKMDNWGAAFKKMTPEDRWQLSKVYAVLANAAPVDSSAWLPFDNFIRYVQGNPAVKEAMHTQIREMAHLWHLLRRIPGPMKDQFNRFPDEFGYDWRTTLGEMDEVPGPMAEFPAIFERPTSLHWHFQELGRIRNEIQSFDEHKRNMDQALNYLTDDPLLNVQRAVSFGPTGTAASMSKLDKVHVNHIIEVLRRKEKAHAIFIQHYLFSPQALEDMAVQAAQQELIEALNATGITDEAMYAQVSPEDLAGASEAIADYEQRRRQWDDPTKEGIEKFRTMPLKPLNLDAGDIILGQYGDSEFAEFVDRMTEFKKLPAQALLATNEASYRNLVQDIYATAPANHDIYNPEKIVRGSEDIPAPGVLSPELSTKEGLERLRGHEIISPREMHEAAIDNLLQTMNLEMPQTIKGFDSILQPTSKAGLFARTMFEKSGIHAGFTNSRAYKFFTEKVLEGIVDVSNKNQVIQELQKFFTELERIDVSAIMLKHRGSSTVLESGESLSMLDVALMSYRSKLPTWEGISFDNRPPDKATGKFWADETLIELIETPPAELGAKLDALIDGVLTGFVEAIIPDSKFDGIDFTGPDVRSNMTALLRGELKAVKRMLDESAEATVKRFGNVDFTDIVGTNELGETTFIRKPISPRQVRQSVIMPRVDRWKDLERALTGDWKTVEIAGKTIQVGVTPARAVMRNSMMEVQSTWKAINLLTPRWQMVVNIDSQLRLNAALQTTVGLAKLGPAFDTLQVRWLRNQGIDVHAKVQNELFEALGGFDRIEDINTQLENVRASASVVNFNERRYEDLLREKAVLENREWLSMVDLYMDKGNDMVEFVGDVIQDEYSTLKKVTRLGASSALGLYFGGPVGAATTAGAFSAHSRVSIQRTARRMVAESYGIAARNAAWVSLREAESADIARWLIEQYPDRYGREQIDASSYGWDDEAWDLTSDTNEIVWPNEELERTLNQPGTTEAKMYAELLRDKNMFVPEDVASFINERIHEEVINRYLSTYAPYIDAVPVKQILTAPFYVNASVATRKVIDARLNEIKRTLSSREQTQIADLTRESIPDAAFEADPFDADVGGSDPLIDELYAIAFDPERLSEFEVVGIESFIPYGDLDIPIADQITFLSGEQAQLLINENLSLVDLAKEFRQSLKDRRHAATILAHGAKVVSDYDKVVVQGFQTTDNQIATRFERAAQILTEGGFSTTQVGSTRIDSAFGDVPQMQEINRRNISANPTARTQLQAGTHIQRKREQYQAARQYDITTPNEQENFIKAYDDTIDRYVSPWGPEGQVASRDFLRQFIRTPDMFRTDDEILRWLNTDGFEAVQDFLPSYKTSENLRELIYKQRYEANSLVPTMLPGFEPVIKKLQAGTTIKWNSDILPALATLQTYVDDFWNAVIQGFKDDLDLRNERGLNESGRIPTTGIEIPEWDTMELLFRAFEFGDGMQGVRSPLRDDSNLLLLGRTGGGIQVPASVRRLVLASYNKIYNEASSFDSQMSLTNKLNLMRYAQRRPLVEQIRLMGEADPIDQNIGELYEGGPIQGEAGLRDFGKTVNDSQYLDSKQTGTIWQRLKGSITGPLETLGEVENIMSRGVMFDALYSSDVLRRLEPFRTPDGPGIYHISPKHLNQLQDKSRKWAQVETKNQLYDLSSRTKMEEAMWLISPFFGAWQEVIGRWFSLARENPVFVARGLRAFSVVAAEDENGQSVMVMQFPNIFEDKDTDVIPFIEGLGLFGDLKVLSEMPMDWKLGSISFISANPGTGFQVSFVVGESILAVPSLDKILGWLIPYGIAEGDNWLQRLVASALPAWIKNLARKGLGDLYLDDERRAATGARVMVDLMTQWNERGDQLPTTEQGKQDFVAEVERITEMIYGMRALRNLIVPTSMIQQSPYYPVIQEYWRVMEEDGPDLADEWLLANHQDLFAATGRTSLTKSAIASTLEGHENYEFHKEDATEYREISSWIIGQDGPEEVKWEFNRNIRRIEQLEGRVERITPTQQFMDATAAEGWREWKDFRTKLYAELAQRKKAGLSGAISSHYKLMQLRRDFITENGRKFPAWANEFNDMGNSQVQAKILAGFRHVMKDPAYETRLDGVFIQQYLDLHDGIAAELESRAQTFNSARWEQLSYKENEDLKIVWELGIAKLLMNPDFGNVYDRFFSNIETVSVANSPLREPATLGSAR